MIFQDPMMTLNPVLTIGTQMEETILAHRKTKRADARAIAVEKLRAVQIPSADTRLKQYPHELFWRNAATRGYRNRTTD